ncbi:MAG TPA: XTP/dITP diphosphatase [Candidatus Binatia bacterium]|nr:XTP/dITP diphosphatase [Candidatus Binatia bacterium]
MVQLLVATTNPGKFAEVEAYLRPLSLRIVSLRNFKNHPAVLEDGATFEENAQKKARVFAEASGLLTLADDSGLEVDALDGAPGIYSARYAGEPADDRKNNEKLLAAMRAVPESQRTARFVCALALCDPRTGAMQIWTIRESCEGRITFQPKGVNGFGYDPLFFYPPLGKTFGEIGREIKATVSHRGKALKKLAELLPAMVNLS